MNKDCELNHHSKSSKTSDFDNSVLKLETQSLPLTRYIDALSFLPYISEDNKNCIRLKKILKEKYLHNIYKQIEKIDLFSDFSIKDENVERLFDVELSDEAIYYVAYSERSLMRMPVTPWGMIYLFSFLLELDLKRFEKWIRETKRNDFKFIFLTILCNYIYNEGLDIKKLDKSRIGLIQAFYAVGSYGLEPNSANSWSRKAEDISKILNCNLSRKNKFYIYYRFLIQEYGKYDINELLKKRDLKNRIKEIISIKYKFLKNDIVREDRSSWFLAFLILKHSKRKDKIDFFVFLAKKIISFFNAQDFLEAFIPYSSLLGMIMFEIGSISMVENKFNSLYKRLSFPYTFCKNRRWDMDMTFLFYLFLAIIVYKKKKKEKCDEYIKKFSELRSYGLFYVYGSMDNTLKKFLNSKEQRLYKKM